MTNIDIVEPTILDSLWLNSTFLEGFYLGRAQWNGSSEHSGQISDFHMWDRPLTKSEMKAWTTCNTDLKGNVIDWASANWQSIRMEKLELNQSICKSMNLGPVLFANQYDPFIAKRLCHKFYGKMFVIKDEKTREIAASLPGREMCFDGHIWSGWSDRISEGTFRSMESKAFLNESQFKTNIWQRSEPNGDEMENCVALTPGNEFTDISCTDTNRPICAICDLGESTIFILRGLCKDSLFDNHYGLNADVTTSEGKYNFRGFSSSFLFWDDVHKLWKITDSKNQSVYATSEGNADGYPMGTNKWNIYNDACNTKSSIKLSFSSCLEDKFNCKNGNW